MIKVGVFGSAGRMGSQVVQAVTDADDMEFVGGVDDGDSRDALTGADVIVDFTRPDAVMDNLAWAIDHDINVVVGTTGFTEERYEQLRAHLAEHPHTGAVVAPNFGIGAVLMMHFAKQAARFYESAEIVELRPYDGLGRADFPDPVTLTWDNGQGLRFTRVMSVDDKYVFSVQDTVQNLGTQAITIAPYGSVQRQGVPPAAGSSHIVHEGAIGTFGKPGDYRTEQKKYKDWLKEPRIENASTGGWLGITDKYWLAALLPQQNEAVETEFRVRGEGAGQQLEANVLGTTRTIQPGATATETQRLFAGVKRAEVLKSYEQSLNLPRFVYAIDWGMFWFLTRPIFMVVEFFFQLLGNFGLAILALTVLVKLLLFPLANKSYESMSKMRNLQPKMEEIKKKFKDDPQKQQQETMALYQREKINPVAGCLPLVLQIPVFYALYKVLTVTIEMRHQPFLGFIHDLSARDPSSIWNLFGLIPWDPAAAPLIGGLLAGPLHLGEQLDVEGEAGGAHARALVAGVANLLEGLAGLAV